jgi:NADH:ubiquinone oxidoreductase subunit F (NADH-binding)
MRWKASAPTRDRSRHFHRCVGLFGKPTVVNNVETLSCVPHIINNGAAWFRGLGRTKDAGTKLYGASGKVKRPGLWELPMGTTPAKFSRNMREECATA